MARAVEEFSVSKLSNDSSMIDTTGGKEPAGTFASYMESVRDKALAAQVRPALLDAVLPELVPSYDVLEKLDTQPEQTLSLADYFARVLPESRIRKARSALRERSALLMDIENTFGPAPHVVVAIWAVESDLGRNRGKFPVLPALATLAWKSRRRAFFENEFLAALRILQLGNVSKDMLVGSWAGAMGHGQFMPSSYLDFGIDKDGDGWANIWGDDPTDALASIANYLAKHGWQRGQPWGLPVNVPDGADLSQSGPETVKPVSHWLEAGITLEDGNRPADYGPASLLLPGGAAGPAFLAFRNFHVLTRYNPAMIYGIAVGLLSELIVGGRPPRKPWPKATPLNRMQLRELQGRLVIAGHDCDVDGLMGPGTARALRAWQAEVGLVADGFATFETLIRMRDMQH